MRLSSNALTFLNNAYRSLYKRAYFSGLASAVALTTLAISVPANATTQDENLLLLQDTETTTNYSDNTNLYATTVKNDWGTEQAPKDLVEIKAGTEELASGSKSYAKNVNVASGVSATIQQTGSPAQRTWIYFTDTMNIKGNITFNNMRVIGASPNGLANHTGKLVVNNGGSLTLNNSYSEFASVNIAGKITLGGSTYDSKSKDDLGALTSILGGTLPKNGDNYININKGADVTLNSHSLLMADDNATFNLNDGKITLLGEANKATPGPANKLILDSTTDSALIVGSNSPSGSKENNRTTTLNFNGGQLIVGNGKDNQVGAIAAQTVNFKGTDVLVNKNSTLTFHSAFNRPDYTPKETKTHFSGAVYTMSSGTITNNGTLNVFTNKDVTKSNFEQKGGSLVNNGIMNVGVKATPAVADADQNAYIVSSGSFTNAHDSTINVHGKLAITDNTKFQNQGVIDIASGGNFEIDIEAVPHASQFVSYTNGKKHVYTISNFSDLGKINNSGTITLSDSDLATFDGGAIYANSFADLGVDIHGTNSNLKGNLVLHTTLNVNEDLILNKDKFGASGPIKTATGKSGELQANKITYQTAQSGGEDLNNITLVADDLVFTGNTNVDGALNVSGTNTGVAFVAQNSLTANNDNAPLVFDNTDLTLGYYELVENNLKPAGTALVDIELGSGSSLTIDDNDWELQNLTIGGNSTATIMTYLEHEEPLNVTAKNIVIDTTVQDENALSIIAHKDKLIEFTAESVKLNNGDIFAKNAILNFGNGLEVSSGKVTIDHGALNTNKLNLTGGSFSANLADITVLGDGNNETIDITGSISLTGGSFNFGNASDTIGLKFENGSFSTGSGYNKININDGTNLKVDLANVGELSIEEANGLLGALATGNGLIDITGATVKLPAKDPNTGNINFEDIAGTGKSDVSIKFDTDESRNAVVGNMSTGDKISGGWKALEATSGTNSLGVTNNNTLALYGTVGNSNNIVGTSDGKVVGLDLGNGSALNLQGSGNIGTLRGSNASVNFNGQEVKVIAQDGTSANVNVKNVNVGEGANVSANQFNVTNLNSTGTINASEIKANSLNLDAKAIVNATTKITAKEAIIAGNLNAKDINITHANIAGGKIKGETTTITGSNLVLQNDAEVNVASIKLDGKGILQIGSEKSETTSSSSASLVAKNVSLNGGMLVLDPEFGDTTATAFISNIGTSTGSEMLVDGDLVVGRNSALGLGNDQASFDAALALQQDGKSLNSNGIGALVYVDRANINLGQNRLVVGTEKVNELTAIASSQQNSYNNAKIYFGEGSALQVTAKALGDKGTVFTGLTATDSIYAKTNTATNTYATFILPANSDEQDLAKLFGSEVALNDGAKIWVQTENGLYGNWIESVDQLHGKAAFGLNLQTSPYKVWYSMSKPSIEYVLDIQSSDSKHHVNEDSFNASVDTTDGAYGINGVAIIDNSTGYNYVRDAISANNGGQSFEQATRLTTLAGVMQSTIIASNSTYDAINTRLGVGGNSDLTVAQTASSALWINPVYRNFEASSLGANGISYGADVDLYGLSLGGDYTLNNGLRLGAMFNIGSGSSDGTGVGSGINNDFNYYGFGLYFGMSPIKGLNIGADINYTKLSNDVDASSNLDTWGKLDASTDTSALSFGLAAQYTINLTALDIAPHIGLRYTKYDKDAQDVKVDGMYLAYNDKSDMKVFSIPVGVKLSKDIINEAWTISPALDLNVTFNAGDKDMVEYTEIDGIYGNDIKYNTDILDSVTYGANLGLNATNGNFAFGVNVGYTGSSNTNEFALGANAKFAF